MASRVKHLSTLFLDMNAFFASVEQQEQPKFRGRPTAVVPTITDNTCCIAVSYEARPYGIHTGTSVREARQRCPKLCIALARPALYVQYHHRIVETVEDCLHVHAIHSVDEMSCRLMRNERDVDVAVGIAKKIKTSVRREIGPFVRCSIGLAPNRFLAKVASNMEKPNGLVVLEPHELPQRLYALALDDLPGIGRNMLRRLQREGIGSMRQLCALSADDMSRIWHSVEGERFWYFLHGYDLADIPTHRRTVGHSHVLPPKWRTREGAYAVLIRLIHKAAARLRDLGYWTRKLSLYVEVLPHTKWREWIRLGLCQDTLSILEGFYKLWPYCPQGKPYCVGMRLSDLVCESSTTLPLFHGERNRVVLSHTMDRINAIFGRHSVYFGGMFGAQSTAPTRISFTNIPDFSQQV